MQLALLLRCGAIAAALVLAAPAGADTAEVKDLIKRGQYSKALDASDQLLAGSPKDAELRFLKGLALTELGRQNDALQIFQALTADYPELPEPYNNLAVLYAQQKEYDKARTALEMAIRTHPTYATAHENLGDVYSRLASQAYSKALQLDAGNTMAQTKLALVRNLISTKAVPAAAAPVQPSRPAAASAPAAASPPAAPAAAARSQAAEPGPATSPTAAADPDAEAVKSAVLAWADAWSRKDVKAYLAHYAPDFVVPGGRPRAAWESERRARVGKPGRISVDIDDLTVELDGARATARFRQHYNSSNFDASASKELELVRNGERWLIHRETVGG